MSRRGSQVHATLAHMGMPSAVLGRGGRPYSDNMVSALQGSATTQ